MKKLIVCLVILLCTTYAHSGEYVDGVLQQEAEGVQIEDAGSYYTDDNVEDALQEIGAGTVVTETDPIASAVNGILKSDGTTLSAATAGTDYYLLGETSSTAYRGDRGKTAYDHSQDNSQAHSDYLINNGNDTTSGTLTAAGFTDSTATLSSGVLNGLTDINATATTDLTLFGTTDVANDANGKSLYIRRMAVEGDSYIRMYMNQYGEPQIYSNGFYGNGLSFSTNSGDFCFLQRNVKYFANYSGNNPTIRHYGWITAVSGARYTQAQINDTTDNYEVTRQDANIGAMDIQMPLITDGITSSADIASSSLTVDTTTLVANASGYEDKVGIGTATPGQNLTVVTNADAQALQIRRHSTADNDPGVLGFRNSTGEGTTHHCEIQSIRSNDPTANDSEMLFRNTVGGSLQTSAMFNTLGNLEIRNAGKLQVNSNGNDKNIKVEHNDTNGVITVSSGALILSANVQATGSANVIVIPTSDPGVAGAIWNNGGTLSISAG